MKKSLTWACIITVAVMTAALTAHGQTSDWPQTGGDMGNTNKVSHNIGVKPTTSWTADIINGPWNAGPILDKNDNIILLGEGDVAVMDAFLTSVDANGNVNWSRNVAGGNWGGCAYSDALDVVYVTNFGYNYTGAGAPDYDIELEAYDASTGNLNWAVNIPDNIGCDTAPTIGPDGTIYIAVKEPAEVHAYTDNGNSASMNWTAPFVWNAGYYTGGIPVYDDGVDTFLYFNTGNSAGNPTLVCLKDAGDHGAVQWSAITDFSYGQGTVDSDGNYYFVGANDWQATIGANIHAYDKNGNLLWSNSFYDDQVNSVAHLISGCVALSADETKLYFGGRNSKVWSLAASDGSLNWSLHLDGGTASSEIVANAVALTDGVIYVVSKTAFYRIHDLGAQGLQVFKVDMPSETNCSPCVKDDGTVYVAPKNSTLYAFEPEGTNVDIMTTSVPDAEAGVPYSAFVTAIGGDRPYAWTIDSGSLPTDLSLNAATGEISGTVTTPADMDMTHNFTVKATDATTPTPTTDTQALSIYVALPQIPFVNNSLPLGAPSEAYSATMVPDTSTNGTPPFNWSYTGTLPPGVSFVSGTFSGTPSTYGDYTVEVSAISSDFYQAKQSVTITVLDPDFWGQFQNNAHHIGTAAVSGPDAFQYKWKIPHSSGNGPPILQGNYVYKNRGWPYNMLKYDAATGVILWQSADSYRDHCRGVPVMGTATDGNIIAALNNRVLAVSKTDGSTSWMHDRVGTPQEIFDGPQLPSYSNGRLFCIIGNNVSQTIDNGGSYTVERIDSFTDIGNPVSIFNTLEHGEVKAFGSRWDVSGFYAVKVSDGTVLWNNNSADELAGIATNTCPAVTSTNICIFGVGDNTYPGVIALDGETGKLRWKTRITEVYNGHAANTPGALSFDQGTVYYNWHEQEGGSRGGELVALNVADGSVKWTYYTGLVTNQNWGRQGTVIVDKEGKVYCIAEINDVNKVLCLEDDGASATLLWEKDINSESPGQAGRRTLGFSVGPDGTLYYAAPDDAFYPGNYDDGYLWAIKAGDAPKPEILDMERGSLTMTFTCEDQFLYKVESSVSPYDYNEANMTWIVEADDIPGRPGWPYMNWTDASPPASGEKYYRVTAKHFSALYNDATSETVGMMVLSLPVGRSMVSSPFEPYPDYSVLGTLIAAEDFESDDDAHWRINNVTLDFSLTDELIINPGNGTWYTWDQVHLASPAYDPAPPYDATGATIRFEAKWVLDTVGGTRDFDGQQLRFRLYSGSYDSGLGTWALEGWEDWDCYPPVPGDNDQWFTWTFVQGTGAVTNYAGPGYDPSTAYYWRFWGLNDLPVAATDEVHLRNFTITETVPYTMGQSTLDKVIDGQLTGSAFSQFFSDTVEVWDNSATNYVRAWNDTTKWVDWDTVSDPPQFGFDADVGYWVNILAFNPPKDVTVFGKVAGTGGGALAPGDRSIPIAVGRNLVGVSFPTARPFSQSNLVTSGFTGSTIMFFSDTVELWDNAAGNYDRYWYDTTAPAWTPWTGGNPLRDIRRGEGLWVTVLAFNPAFTWTIPVPPNGGP